MCQENYAAHVTVNMPWRCCWPIAIIRDLYAKIGIEMRFDSDNRD